MTVERPLRVIVWAAVSSAPQAAADKVSLSDQERVGREFADAIGGQVVDVLVDPGESRSLIFWQDAEAAIPAYRVLREHCQRRDFDVLHTIAADRLGRTQALTAQVYAIVEQAGAEVYDASAPHTIGQSTIANRYIAAIQSVQAEQEIVKLRARHRAGMRGRVKRGLHSGHWPYGYEAVRDEHGHCTGAQFVAVEVEAMRHITRLFLAGETYNAIAQQMAAAGYPTRRGGAWSGVAVRNFVSRDDYAGFPAWDGARPAEPSECYPRLWDDATYAAVVAERRRRGTVHRHATALNGVAFCARCGARMHRHYSADQWSGHVYLFCSTHRADTSECHTNYIREDVVQAAVVDYLAPLLAGDLDLLAVDDAPVKARLDAEIARLDGERETVDGQRRRLAHALAAGQMDVVIYRATDDELLARLDWLQAERVTAQARRDAVPDAQQRRVTLEELRADLAELWAMPPRRASTLLQAAGVRVFVEDGAVVRVGFAVRHT